MINKKICQPLQLSFIKQDGVSRTNQILSQATIKKWVHIGNIKTRRKHYFTPKEDLFRSFTNPKIYFRSLLGDDFDQEDDKEDDDDDETDVSFHDQPMDLSLDNALTMPGCSQQTNVSEFSKLPRYVTDFGGGSMDPFGLGEQNREFVTHTLAADEPVPIEEKDINYTTRMKKINIKKLKKVMFSFIEPNSMVSFVCLFLCFGFGFSNFFAFFLLQRKKEFEDYVEKNGKQPESCISFYKLMYYIIYHGNLDERTLDDLTIPIFFVATLHLCNDKVTFFPHLFLLFIF